MLKSVKTLCIITTLTVLSACGGGSDDSGGGTTTPTNSAPTITLSTSNIDLNERSSSTIDVTTSDAENDTITVTASSNNNTVTADYSNNVLTITTSEINTDTTVTITVTATDSKSASSTKTLTVNVKDLPNQSPELAWIGEQPSMQMSELTKLSIPFNVSDSDTDLSALIFDVTFDLVDGYQKEENMPTFEIDLENKLLILNAKESDDIRSELLGTFSVFDGQTKKSINLNINLHSNNAFTTILFERDYIVEGGSSLEMAFDMIVNNPNKLVFGEVSFQNDIDKAENLLSWSLNTDNKTLEVSADITAVGKSIPLKIEFTDRGLYSNSGERFYDSVFVNVYVRNVVTQNEIDLMAKYELFTRNIELSKEYEKVAEFLLDYLLINQKISKAKYDELHSDTYAVRFPIYTLSDEYEYTIKNKLLTTNFYADTANSQPMIDMLNTISSQAETTWAREMVDFINDDILSLVGEINTTIPSISFTDSYSYTNGELVSRLVGKPVFGTYIDGKWVFNDTYSFLRASSAITLNDGNL